MGILTCKYERELCRPWFVLAVLTCVYVFLPSSNCSGDALCYAADVRYGNNLFQPHHLLHTAFGYSVYRGLTAFMKVDALRLMAFISALFAGGCLFVLYKILRMRHGNTIVRPLAATVVAGVSFGFMRFSVEGEAYIIPLFWSLVSSYCYCKYLVKKQFSWVIGTALAASVACLFHQVHVFWGVALFLGLMAVDRKQALCYAATCILVVTAAYMLVVVGYAGMECSLASLLQYVSSYYHSGSGHLSVSLVNLEMTPISVFRTFLQVHGNFLMLWGHARIYVCLGFFGLFLLLWALKMLFTSVKYRSPKKFFGNVLYENIHLLAFGLQFVFAFLSDGNAEFMVMLPFLMAIFLPPFVEVKSTAFLVLLGVGMFVWNMSVAIVPQHILNYYNPQAVVEFVNRQGNCRYLATDYQVMVNQNYYETGIDEDPRYVLPQSGFEKIDSLKSQGLPVFSDWQTYLAPFSRATLLQRNNSKEILKGEKVGEVYSDFGSYEIRKY